MLTNGLRAALVVTLVLAFAVVFGLGRLMAVSIPPAPPPATPVPSGSAVENAEPSVLGEPGVDPQAIPDGAQTSVLGVPDEAGHVSLGIVAPKADYPAEPLHPSVRQTMDGRLLKVCVRLGPNQRISDTADEWRQDDPPDGDRYCVYVQPGDSVEFTLVTQ